MRRVLLTGSRAPATLDLARHFYRAGHEVYLVDSLHLPLARLSRMAKKSFVVTPPTSNPSKYVEDLVAIVRRHQIDLVIPTCEEIFFIAARIESFSGLADVFAEPLSKLAILHNKWTFVQQVAALNEAVQAPETHLLSSSDEVESFLNQHTPTEWVFKPVYSRFAARTLIRPNRTQAVCLQPTSCDPWVVQRCIRGQELSTYSVVQSGRLRAHACYRSKYRVGPGSGIYFLNHVEPRIQQFVEQFVMRNGFTGQIGFDFMLGNDSQVYVLECNPRATSGLHLLHSEPLVDAFLNIDGPLIATTSEKPASLILIMLLFAFPESIRQGRFVAMLRDLWKARDVMFAWHDPGPFLFSPLSLLEVFFKAFRQRKLLTQAATDDIEWNGEPL
jgi:ATP-grasp domain